jgi:hypothetical protein
MCRRVLLYVDYYRQCNLFTLYLGGFRFGSFPVGFVVVCLLLSLLLLSFLLSLLVI